MKKQILSVVLFGMLAGCTNNPAKEVSSDIDASMNANKEATAAADWETSEFHPAELFSKWRNDKVMSAEVCKQLLGRDVETLTLFEEELKAAENKDLVKDCKNELQSRLEKYWKQEREHLEVQLSQTKIPTKEIVEGKEQVSVRASDGASFRFPDNVQKRDFSDGYYTVTGDVGKKEVVLTFDDGPHGVYTDMILKALADVNAKAIFFATAKSVKGNPETLKRVARAGHGVGSHSINHYCLASNQRCQNNNRAVGRLSFAQATGEIIGGHQAVQNVLGWVDPFFRFPYGESDANLKKYLRENSTGEFYWTIDSNDWRTKTPAQVVSDTMGDIEKRGRGIVLFHDVQRRTAEALPTFLKQLYYKGYSVVLLKPTDDQARYNSKIVKK